MSFGRISSLSYAVTESVFLCEVGAVVDTIFGLIMVFLCCTVF